MIVSQQGIAHNGIGVCSHLRSGPLLVDGEPIERVFKC